MRLNRLTTIVAAVVALLGAGALHLSAAYAQGAPPPPPDKRTKYCVVIYSHNFKDNNSKPIHYKYQWCDARKKCTSWHQRSLTPGGKSFASRVQCYNATRRVKMKIRYDWKFARGFQAKSYDLAPQTFPYKRKRLPNSGCIRRAAYHFVSGNGELHLYRGEPKNVKRLSCRWVDAQ